MKLWIRIAVIAAHLAVIGVILGTCRPEGCRRGRGAAAGAPEVGGAGDGKTGPEQSLPDTPGEGGVARAPTDATAGKVSYSESFFQRGTRRLPADLEAATAACRTGVLVDWTARSVLWGKGENKPVPVASLTKMMTVLLLMEDVASRSDLDLDTRIAVTKEAAAIGGRQVWLDPRETFSVEDLLRCVLIHSGNDAAYLVAQTLEGSEAAFVERMNRRARELGLTTAKFLNSHGLPDEATRQENVASAIELAFLAGQLLDYPAVVERSGTRLSFLEPRIDGKKTQLLNTNKLVGRVAGVNGMKTGYTNNSGYCLTATCERNRRQAVVVVTGCDRGTARDDLAAKLLEWLYATP